MFNIPLLSKSRSENAAVRSTPRLPVRVGVSFAAGSETILPSPSWPELPLPQQETEPLSRIAQECLYPREIPTAVRFVPRLLVKVGLFLFGYVEEPCPSLPCRPSPQQETEPLSRIAQV